MTESDSASIHRELGGIAAALKDIERRLEHVEEKQDKLSDLANDVKHMRGNIAMMKQPVEDYKKMKERGIGAWTLITLLSGGAVVVFNVISYVIRAYVLGIGNP